VSPKILTLISSGGFFFCGLLAGLEHAPNPASAQSPPAAAAQECTGQACPAPTAAPALGAPVITVTPGPAGSWGDLSIDVIADSDQLLGLEKNGLENEAPAYDGPLEGDVNWGVADASVADASVADASVEDASADDASLDEAPYAAPTVHFVDEYSAWNEAGRWLWVHVTGAGCEPCAREAQLFKDPRVVAASEHLACCELDATDPRIRAYGVGCLPTDFLVGPDRRTMHRFEGAPADIEELLARLGHSIVTNRAPAPATRSTSTTSAPARQGLFRRTLCGGSCDPR
jgi:hypothetical protein